MSLLFLGEIVVATHGLVDMIVCQCFPTPNQILVNLSIFCLELVFRLEQVDFGEFWLENSLFFQCNIHPSNILGITYATQINSSPDVYQSNIPMEEEDTFALQDSCTSSLSSQQFAFNSLKMSSQFFGPHIHAIPILYKCRNFCGKHIIHSCDILCIPLGCTSSNQYVESVTWAKTKWGKGSTIRYNIVL